MPIFAISKQILDMATQDFKDALKLFSSTAKPFFKGHVSSSYRSFIAAIQNELEKISGTQILEDWILPQIKSKYTNSVFDLIENITDEFDKTFAGYSVIPSTKKGGLGYDKSDCQAALKAFAKFILGQYKANLYVALQRGNDLANCKLVARNAFFCTVKIANEIKSGLKGSKLNKKIQASGRRGNDYYSWFYCAYQRKRPGQNKMTHVPILQGQPNIEGLTEYILDDNSYANQAIKKAVLAGMPRWMQATASFYNFDNYMACHVWDKTCYDYRYHTSVFNLVLLPTSIGGLSDYCPAVKELLRYEAAMRFRVYPIGQPYKLSPNVQKIYDILDNGKYWRQLEEHEEAKKRTDPIIAI